MKKKKGKEPRLLASSIFEDVEEVNPAELEQVIKTTADNSPLPAETEIEMVAPEVIGWARWATVEDLNERCFAIAGEVEKDDFGSEYVPIDMWERKQWQRYKVGYGEIVALVRAGKLKRNDVVYCVYKGKQKIKGGKSLHLFNLTRIAIRKVQK
jgi:hypothetical protein